MTSDTWRRRGLSRVHAERDAGRAVELADHQPTVLGDGVRDLRDGASPRAVVSATSSRGVVPRPSASP